MYKSLARRIGVLGGKQGLLDRLGDRQRYVTASVGRYRPLVPVWSYWRWLGLIAAGITLFPITQRVFPGGRLGFGLG